MIADSADRARTGAGAAGRLQDSQQLLDFSRRLFLATGEYDARPDTSALEWQVDDLVDALYGLTPEEIKLVEEGMGK